MHKFIGVILLMSLGLNIYLLLQIEGYKASVESEINDSNDKTSQVARAAQSQSDKKANPFASRQETNKQNAAFDADKAEQQKLAEAVYEAPQNFSAEELFELIQSLQSNQQYAELTLPLREYLKRYPDDYRAWLIEADLTLHTEPLNTAIAFYYGLLDKNLPALEIAKVKSIIQVNTSKVVQQLSGDTAWDLLATFIEPLLQIDPLNRRYIMGLAKAYGKQEQLILMENVLAALPYDDARAQRLRKSFYDPEQSEIASDIEDESRQTAGLTKRRVPVSGNGEQFFVKTKFDRYSHLMLLDTGASTTAISQRVFIRIPSSDKEFIGRFAVQTAGGSIQAPMFKLSAIELGKIAMSNVSVIVLPEENFKGPFQGLLGMNVLRNFEFRFDPEKQQMILFER
ncbi:MAG: clan AA aspartic protease (TIGR02281 family) [Glaciecola sp.]|jgi:clan AA aspartic protease (TIGR02281 family)